MAPLLVACNQEPAGEVSGEVVQAVVESPPAAAQAEAVAIDPGSGLVIDEHWELVKGHCSACHSPRLITQNRGNRRTWLEMIRGMQETQGLWQFDETTENAMLDYLEKNYAPAAQFRRAPLPGAQMPRNPYAGRES